jgi:hypothetical protein
MCRWGLTAIAIAIAGLWAAPANAITGKDLRQLCTRSPAQCLQIVSVVADLLRQSSMDRLTTSQHRGGPSVQINCPIPGEAEAVAKVLRYLRQHPNDLGDDAIALIRIALEGDCVGRPLGLWDKLAD